jgi:hypothetical protein
MHGTSAIIGGRVQAPGGTNWLGQIDKDPYAGHAEEEKSLLRTAPSDGYHMIIQET